MYIQRMIFRIYEGHRWILKVMMKVAFN